MSYEEDAENRNRPLFYGEGAEKQGQTSLLVSRIEFKMGTDLEFPLSVWLI